MEEKEDKGAIHIGRAGGDVIGVGVSGSGNIIGSNIATGDNYGSSSRNVAVDEEVFKKIPSAYADALKAICDRINADIEKQLTVVNQSRILRLNSSLDEMAAEMTHIDYDTESRINQKETRKITRHIMTMLMRVLELVADISPVTVKFLSDSSVLRPFSKLIGIENLEYILKEFRIQG